MDEIRYGSHLHCKIYPSRTIFWGTRTIFIRAVPKIFCSVNGPLVNLHYSIFHSVLQRLIVRFKILCEYDWIRGLLIAGSITASSVVLNEELS